MRLVEVGLAQHLLVLVVLELQTQVLVEAVVLVVHLCQHNYLAVAVAVLVDIL
jgi:hypothetical protein